MAKKKKQTSFEKEYPDGVRVNNFKMPEEEENLALLKELHPFDTLCSSFMQNNGGGCMIEIEGFGFIPFYSFHYHYFTYLIKKEVPLPILIEYAKGYTEGLNEEFTPPYFDTPENRKINIVNILSGLHAGLHSGFPFTQIEGHEPHVLPDSFYFQYGKKIGRERRAWDIVYNNQDTFKEFLAERWGSNKPKTVIASDSHQADKAALTYRQAAIIEHCLIESKTNERPVNGQLKKWYQTTINKYGHDDGIYFSKHFNSISEHSKAELKKTSDANKHDIDVAIGHLADFPAALQYAKDLRSAIE